MIKCLLFVVIKVIDTLEINQISVGTWNKAKVLLSGVFGIFHLFVVTCVYQQERENDKQNGDSTKTVVCAPPDVEQPNYNCDNTQSLYPPILDENATLAPFKTKN